LGGPWRSHGGPEGCLGIRWASLGEAGGILGDPRGGAGGPWGGGGSWGSFLGGEAADPEVL